VGLRLPHLRPDRTPRPARLIALTAALAALAAACGGGGGAPPATPVAPAGGALTVRAFEWGFEPESIALRRGERVEVLFQNDGRILHDLLIEELDASGVESRSSGPFDSDGDELFVGAGGGGEGTLAFTPEEAGEFVFYCTISGHRQLGMEGRIVVEDVE
jgi:uncharacterized cupredoxin-like copper-binding protein